MEKSKRIKENKAVTLIALVVTIVVLIILAGISISALTGDKGIINQAHTAKEDTEIASWEEQIDLAIIDAEKKHRNPTLEDVKEELKNKGVIDDYSQVTEKGVITTNEPVYEIPGKLDDYIPFGPGVIAKKNELYEDINGDEATIPAGFTVSENKEEQIIDKGLVIKDREGHEFVWIPVTGAYEMNRTYAQVNLSQKVYMDIGYLPDGIEKGNREDNEKAERDAVISKGGFYISRYENGNKKGEEVQLISSEEGCKTEAKSFINNSNVKSGLCSGTQWDMVMEFITQYDKNYDVTSSEAMRHPGGNIKSSGQNEYDKTLNIYDLEGNALEFTGEKADIQGTGVILRGGNAWSTYAVSYREFYYNDGWPSYAYRIVLYVM